MIPTHPVRTQLSHWSLSEALGPPGVSRLLARFVSALTTLMLLGTLICRVVSSF